MVFSSLFFLFGFLPLFFGVYFLTPRMWKNQMLLAASLGFYFWGAPQFTLILLASAVVDFFLARLIDRKGDGDRLFLFLSLVINLGIFAYFKYANFFVAQLGLFGLHPAWREVLLPVGISFITFHKVSYAVDVYRKRVVSAKRFSDYLLYILLFPQLVAGPIVRYHHIESDLTERNVREEDLRMGIERFIIGLSKKVLIANYVGRIADNAFTLSGVTGYAAWVGIIAYAVQIYFDFSGYTDMALGLGRMMGFHFPENFNHPYRAISITDFWRRWHMSLTAFMREYVYIPLGGNRKGELRTYLNLFLVFFLSGIWHGAAWTFVLWGAYYGLLLVFERIPPVARVLEATPIFLRRVWTILLVLFGWVLFRAEDVPHAWRYLRQMFDFSSPVSPFLFWGDLVTIRGLSMLVCGVLLLWFPFDWLTALRGSLVLVFFRVMSLFLLFTLSVLSITNAGFNPFIYFRF